MRDVVRSADALGASPQVAIDPAWSDRNLRETVMAQVCEWVLRSPRQGAELASDAVDWYARWASRAAGREVGAGELYEFVRGGEAHPGALPPDSPGGHRAYYRKSLRSQEGRVAEAARRVGLSRRQAYRRLVATGRRLDEFESIQAVVASLISNAPKKTGARRELVERLVQRRLQRTPAHRQATEQRRAHEWARKLERRTRSLPPEEQNQRIIRALRRQAGVEA